MRDIDYHELITKFRGLIADHGTFAKKQLAEYVARMTGEAVDADALARYAVAVGARRQAWDGDKNAVDPEICRFPVKRRKGLPGRKQDQNTPDMFHGKTNAEVERERRKEIDRLFSEHERLLDIAYPRSKLGEG